MNLLERARQLKLQALQQGKLLQEEVAISVALTEYQEFNDARFAVIAGIVAALAPFDPLIEGLEALVDFDPEAAKARRAQAAQQTPGAEPPASSSRFKASGEGNGPMASGEAAPWEPDPKEGN